MLNEIKIKMITELTIKTKTGQLRGFLYSSGHYTITLEIFRHHEESMDIIKRENLMHNFEDIYCRVQIPITSLKKNPPKHYETSSIY